MNGELIQTDTPKQVKETIKRIDLELELIRKTLDDEIW